MPENEIDIFDDLYDDEPQHQDTTDEELFTADETADDDYQVNSLVSIPVTDDDDDEEEEEDEETGHNPPKPAAKQTTIVDHLLTAKGITDGKVQYENEEGEIELVDFHDLPQEEQLAILQSDDKDINYGLADEEIQTVNFLRQNNVTFEDAIEYFKKEAVEQYIASQTQENVEIDQFTDEQLFALDLKAKYDELTEEEIEIELTKQLEHPELFKKKVDKLRTDYSKIEAEQRESVRLEKEQEEERTSTELRSNLITVAQGIEDIGGLDLDNNDKNEILAYILEKDINGVSPFLKSLDSPKQLFELAWYATKGKEAFEIVHDYYKKEIDKVRKTAYEKAKTDLSKKNTEKPTKTTSFVKRGNNDPKQPKYPSIDDFDLHD